MRPSCCVPWHVGVSGFDLVGCLGYAGEMGTGTIRVLVSRTVATGICYVVSCIEEAI